MSPNPRLVPFIRVAAVAAIVAGAAAWARPRRVEPPRAQVCRGGVYTLIVEPPPR